MKDKILFYSFYSSHSIRGVETFLDNLIAGLSDEYETVLVRAGKNTRIEKNEISISSRHFDQGNDLLEKLFISKRKLSELWFYLRGIRALFARPKLVVILNCGWHLFIYRLVTYILKIRLVLVGESGLGWDDKINLFVRPDIFVALSNSQAKWAKKYSLGMQKIVVIPNGVNDLFFKNKTKVNLFTKGKTVVTVSAITRSKNLEVVLRALELSPYNWLLLGKGDDDFVLKAKKKMGKRFINKTVPYLELPKYLLGCDLFVLIQNSYEAFGNVFIEAGAVGLPIVCGDDPIRREILFNQAEYVKDIYNEHEVLRSIVEGIGKRSSKEIYKKYEYKNIVKLWKELIENA